jgi:hypothetical protein
MPFFNQYFSAGKRGHNQYSILEEGYCCLYHHPNRPPCQIEQMTMLRQEWHIFHTFPDASDE